MTLHKIASRIGAEAGSALANPSLLEDRLAMLTAITRTRGLLWLFADTIEDGASPYASAFAHAAGFRCSQALADWFTPGASTESALAALRMAADFAEQFQRENPQPKPRLQA